MNKVILIGRLGADPEVRELKDGAKVAKLRVATSESYRDKAGEWQEATEWHTVIAWRQLADKAEKLAKGDAVVVDGKMTYRNWQDKDGNNRVSAEVVANYFRRISKSERVGSSSAGTYDDIPASHTVSPGQPNSEPTTDGEPDDLPF